MIEALGFRERRRFPRIPISVDVRAKHGDLSVIKARSFNISVGGIGLLSSRQLPSGRVMELEMDFPVPVVIGGSKVAWTKEMETDKGKFFKTGLDLSTGSIIANSEMKSIVSNAMQARQQKSNVAEDLANNPPRRRMWLAFRTFFLGATIMLIILAILTFIFWGIIELLPWGR